MLVFAMVIGCEEDNRIAITQTTEWINWIGFVWSAYNSRAGPQPLMLRQHRPHYPLTCRLLTYLLHAARSFLRATRSTASQNIPRILWNTKVYHRIHECPPPVPILSLINPVHVLTSHCLNIHFNIIYII